MENIEQIAFMIWFSISILAYLLEVIVHTLKYNDKLTREDIFPLIFFFLVCLIPILNVSILYNAIKELIKK